MTEDLIKILKHYQQYAPITDKGIKKIKCSGDGLSIMRAHDALTATMDGLSTEARLEGIVNVSEDWHQHVIMLQDAFTDYFNPASVAEKGTMYQIKIRFQRKNVKKEVKKAVDDDRRFLHFITRGYTVLAAMEILKLKDQNEKPTTSRTNLEVLQEISQKILDEYVLRYVQCISENK